MTRSKWFGTLLVCFMFATAGDARAGELPGGYSCNDLRSTVASYGASLVLTAARGRGFSEREIVNIRRRCKV